MKNQVLLKIFINRFERTTVLIVLAAFETFETETYIYYILIYTNTYHIDDGGDKNQAKSNPRPQVLQNKPTKKIQIRFEASLLL